MSAVKSFAFGVSMMVLAAQQAPAGSMHSAQAIHRSSHVRTPAPPTTLAFAPAPAPSPAPAPPIHLAAQNLFGPMPVAALSLGVTGSNPSPGQATFASSFAQAVAPADAFINFGNGAYPEASSLTTGSSVAFFNSPAFRSLFGANGPSIDDVGRFETEVLATIRATYNNVGLPIHLTIDPYAPAAHTLSVVSGSSYPGSPGAIGITDVGNNGFSFIDKLTGAPTVDQLAVAVGHNLSHELMHAFGVSDHPEQSGPFVDAASSTLSTLADPSTGFSPAAASLLSTLKFQAVGQAVTAGAQRIDGGQMLLGQATVPEPSTVATWLFACGLLAARYRGRKSA